MMIFIEIIFAAETNGLFPSVFILNLKRKCQFPRKLPLAEQNNRLQAPLPRCLDSDLVTDLPGFGQDAFCLEGAAKTKIGIGVGAEIKREPVFF